MKDNLIKEIKEMAYKDKILRKILTGNKQITRLIRYRDYLKGNPNFVEEFMINEHKKGKDVKRA